MSDTKYFPYFYSFFQYFPDYARQEAVNLGVIMDFPTDNFTISQGLTGDAMSKRILDLDRSYGVDLLSALAADLIESFARGTPPEQLSTEPVGMSVHLEELKASFDDATRTMYRLTPPKVVFLLSSQTPNEKLKIHFDKQVAIREGN